MIWSTGCWRSMKSCTATGCWKGVEMACPEATMAEQWMMDDERGMRRNMSEMCPSLIAGWPDPWCPWLPAVCDLYIVGDT